MQLLMLCFIGYLIGHAHGSTLVGYLTKINIKKNGVQNAGASNATLLLGWKWGVCVALIDISKGFFPVFYLALNTQNGSLPLLILGTSIILGHNYPVHLQFNGGKGTASMIGVAFALDWHLGTLSLGVLILVALLTDYLAIGVLAFYISVLTCAILFEFEANAIGALVFLFILFTFHHTENFRRIRRKTETKISSLWKKT